MVEVLRLKTLAKGIWHFVCVCVEVPDAGLALALEFRFEQLTHFN